MFKHKNIFIGLLVSCSAFCASNAFAAENATDDVTITVPVACSITSTINTAHTATIDLGTYEDDIGETTFNVLCNDSNGFAVYAVGFSDDTLGNNVMKPSTLPAANAIATGTATSGGTSNWAMKLTAVSGDYTPTLETGFNVYHAVPNESTKVASLASNTDATVGSSFKSTYAVYISGAQPADTYTGKVKYTVIHPASVTAEALSNAVTLNFDGNGLSFEDGSETNTIQYAEVCEEAEQAYISTAHEDVTSSNFDSNGNQTGSYTDSEDVLQTITHTGADKLKVVVDYDITGGTTELIAVEGTWDGNWGNLPEDHKEIYSSNNISGTKTYLMEGDTVTIRINSWNTPEANHNYGFFVKVYSVYETEQTNTTLEDLPCDCHIQSISGAYEETTTWKGRWDVYINENLIASFYNESDLINYINEYYDDIKGGSFNIVAYNPYTITYNGNNATNGDMERHTIQKESLSQAITLTPPNYYKNGYGFAGWSQDSIINSSSVIFGPNQDLNTSNLNFDSTRTATLYAVWIPSNGNLQNWSGCSSMSVGNVTALADTRDNNTYAIAKLPDGRCWMIENLRLDLSTASISTSDTDDPTSDFINIYVANIKNGTDNQLWKGGKNYFVKEISFDKLETTFDNLKIFSYGVKYNWFTTAAGTVNTKNDVASGSICPKGWKLPKADEFEDYLISSASTELEKNSEEYDNYLQSEESSIALRSYPFSIVYAGWHYQNNYNQLRGQSAGYWSNENSSLLVNNSYSHPRMSGELGTPGNGQTIRCILDE